MIERDNSGGSAARVKRLIEVDLDDTPAADGTLPTRTVVDLLRIRDPFGVSLPAPAGGFGFGDPFAFPFVSVETVLPLGGDRLLMANDNNFPGDAGRVPGKPDDLEAIILRVPGLEGGGDRARTGGASESPHFRGAPVAVVSGRRRARFVREQPALHVEAVEEAAERAAAAQDAVAGDEQRGGVARAGVAGRANRGRVAAGRGELRIGLRLNRRGSRAAPTTRAR